MTRATKIADNDVLMAPRFPNSYTYQHLTTENSADLAILMYEAYNTENDHNGESQEDAIKEISDTFKGKYGLLIHEASFGCWVGGELVSAVMVTLYNNSPLIAFCMTMPEHKMRGFCSSLLLKSLTYLNTLGHNFAKLYVSNNNIPAMRLYNKLGFEVQSEEKSNNISLASLITLVPLGLDSAIFPWGPQLITDSVKSENPERNCQLLDLRSIEGFKEFHDENKNLLTEVFINLKPAHRILFFGHTLNPLIFLEAISILGRDVEKFLINKKSHLIDALELLKMEFDELLRLKLNYFGSLKNAVIAISVFDYTIFGALNVARVLKSINPELQIILGGDYFNRDTAQSVVRNLDFVDAVVVGYGEETLSQLLRMVDCGKKLESTRLVGVYTSSFHGIVNGAFSTFPPSFYDSEKHTSPVSFVAIKNNEIRVLSQRGCSWGKCTFCSQIDRKRYYSVGREQLFDDLLKSLNELKALVGPIKISIDADENDLGLIQEIAKVIYDNLDKGQQVEISFWLMVRSYKKFFSEMAIKFSDKISFTVWLNIESLNQNRLRLMKKGFSALQAIEAMKAILDAGQKVTTNYFTYYPGDDDSESAKQEAMFLRRCSHVFAHNNISMAAFPYAMNGRDEVSTDQEKYKLRLTRIPDEEWVLTEFGVDIPFTIWAFDLTPPEGIDDFVGSEIQWHKTRKVLQSSYSGLKKIQTGFTPPASNKKDSSNGLFKDPFPSELKEYQIAMRHLNEISKKPIYVNFNKRISALNALQLQLQNKSSKTTRGSFLGYKKIEIRNNRLIIEKYDGAGVNEHFLTDDDTKMLNDLYWIRSEGEMKKNHEGFLTRIQHYIEIGVVLKLNSKYLSLALSPSYWINTETGMKAPTRLHNPENRKISKMIPALLD